MWGINCAPSPFKLEENKERNLTTKNAISKAQEATKIPEFYRVIFEIPEKKSEWGIERRKKLKLNGDVGWKQEVDSSDRIGQLGASRFKTQMGSKNLSRGKSDGISDNEMPDMGKQSRMGKHIARTATPLGNLKLCHLARIVPFLRCPYSEIHEGGSLIAGGVGLRSGKYTTFYRLRANGSLPR